MSPIIPSHYSAHSDWDANDVLARKKIISLTAERRRDVAQETAALAADFVKAAKQYTGRTIVAGRPSIALGETGVEYNMEQTLNYADFTVTVMLREPWWHGFSNLGRFELSGSAQVDQEGKVWGGGGSVYLRIHQPADIEVANRLSLASHVMDMYRLTKAGGRIVARAGHCDAMREEFNRRFEQRALWTREAAQSNPIL